jgi:hypothetical protein
LGTLTGNFCGSEMGFLNKVFGSQSFSIEKTTISYFLGFDGDSHLFYKGGMSPEL